jgi:nitroimidazol reductase NimA-like FMN-containing flavoprotein (pyridoxamine 5'-phosphate oxidase superfamily)
MVGRVTEMTTGDCWDLLGRQEMGRLAYHRGDEVHIAPLNFAVDGHRIIFRTAEGSKLAGILTNGDVAFEADELNDEAAMSVVARGRAVELHGDEALMVDQLRLRPWVRTPKEHVIAIQVADISGRFFVLTKPWAHMMH